MNKNFIGIILLLLGGYYAIWTAFYKEKRENASVFGEISSIYDIAIPIILIICGIILMIKSWIEYAPTPC